MLYYVADPSWLLHHAHDSPRERDHQQLLVIWLLFMVKHEKCFISFRIHNSLARGDESWRNKPQLTTSDALLWG